MEPLVVLVAKPQDGEGLGIVLVVGFDLQYPADPARFFTEEPFAQGNMNRTPGNDSIAMF